MTATVGTTNRGAVVPPAKPGFDVVAFLTLWLVLLFGINARQVVGVFGAIGSPALLLAMPAMGLWAAGWILPGSGIDRRPHPMRVTLLFYFWWLVFSFTVALARPLSGLESSGSARALITGAALVGIGLLVADGITTMERLETLLRRLVVAVGALCVVGIIQAFTGHSMQFSIPGLQWNSELLAVAGRSLFNRPTGTTLHPIEFSVIPAALLPLVIHFVLYGDRRASRVNMGAIAALIVLAVPLSISRSGLLAAFASLAIVALAWDWRRRANAAVLGVAAIPVLWLGVPGLVGTLLSLFTNVSTDPSIQARLDRGPRIMAMIRDRPWVGLGRGTWSVEQYFLVDNQLWVTTMEEGIPGLALLVILFLVAIFTGILVKHLPGVDERTGHLAHAVAASLTGIGVSFATFDAFHYRILTGVMFLLLGVIGAIWRLTRFAEVTDEPARARA